MRRKLLVTTVAALVALIAASVFDEAFGVANFAASTARSLLGVASSAALAAMFAAVASDERARRRHAAAAAVFGAAISYVLLRGPSPWTDLGPFGAGPLTALAVGHLPAVVVTAMACAFAMSDESRAT